MLEISQPDSRATGCTYWSEQSYHGSGKYNHACAVAEAQRNCNLIQVIRHSQHGCQWANIWMKANAILHTTSWIMIDWMKNPSAKWQIPCISLWIWMFWFFTDAKYRYAGTRWHGMVSGVAVSAHDFQQKKVVGFDMWNLHPMSIILRRTFWPLKLFNIKCLRIILERKTEPTDHEPRSDITIYPTPLQTF